MRFVSHAVCRSCWNVIHSNRTPHRLVEPDEETCCRCGELTTSGIYMRDAKQSALFPRCSCE